MSFTPPRRRTQISPRATGRLGMCSYFAMMTVALLVLIPSTAIAADPPAYASVHGRVVQAPHREDGAVVIPASSPAGWSAGPVKMGTGFRHPGGSQRVREVQRRLQKLGFTLGPVDGLFGPLTYAAVERFQITHGLAIDGIVGVHTLARLRELTGAAPAIHVPEPVRGQHPAARSNTPQAQHARQREDNGQEPAGGHGTASASTALVVIALLLLAAPAALALHRRRTRTPKPRRPVADRKVAGGPAPQRPAAASPAPAVASPARTSLERPPAIGYVRSTRDHGELARHAGAIKRACTSRGWELAELVRDDRRGGSRTLDRPGLEAVKERLSAPGPSRLVVSKLGHLSHSAADLIPLFEWFDKHEVEVIALDVGIDTTTPAGRRAAQSLLPAVAQRQAHARTNRRNSGHEKVEVGAAAGHSRPGDEGGSY